MTDRNLTMDLTGYDRQLIAEARDVAGLDGGAVRAHTGEDDMCMAYAVAFGRRSSASPTCCGLMERLAELETAKAAARYPHAKRLGILLAATGCPGSLCGSLRTAPRPARR